MPGLTLEIAQQKLDLWLAADAAVAKDQEHWVEGRRVTRADARTIRQNIDFWDRKVKALSGAGRRVGYVRSR
jgi:hypothetical protein